MAHRPDPSSNAPAAPHPTLRPYYQSDRDKAGFVRRLFDASAAHYDRIEGMMALGTGPWYRRQALTRAGLTAGMEALDVAIGTGLVAREAVTVVGESSRVVGLDPSVGMLREARRTLGIRAVLGRGEELPFPDRRFDFLSMGYALRHLADLNHTFREFVRVLKPGGIACILELTRPPGRLRYALLRFYLHRVVPTLTRLTTGNREAALLMRYFWDTIDACVPPEQIMTAMEQAGLEGVTRTVVLGLFSEYVGRRPPVQS